MPGVRGTSPLSGMVFTAVFTEWCRSPVVLKSRMWDSGWDTTVPPDVRLAGKPCRMRAPSDNIETKPLTE